MGTHVSVSSFLRGQLFEVLSLIIIIIIIIMHILLIIIIIPIMLCVFSCVGAMLF
jgi:hypothetical protein